jgi:photosystem II stability/assembly factor-like uncharacterized protein
MTHRNFGVSRMACIRMTAILALVPTACSGHSASALGSKSDAPSPAAATPECAAAAYGKPCLPPAPSPTPTPLVRVTALSSVAFSDPVHGWALGSDCFEQCAIEVATTMNGGVFWQAPQIVGTVSAPPAGDFAAVGADIRFVGQNGWIFGPGIFQTHDSGRSWHRTVEAPIDSLEPYADTVWAIQGCNAAPCTPRLLVSQPDSDTWRVAVPQPTFGIEAPGQPGVPGTVLERASGGVAFVSKGSQGGQQALYVSRDIGRSWQSLSAPCTGIVSVRSIDGQHVWALCSVPCCTQNYVKGLYVSSDGGQHWRRQAATDPTPAGSIPFMGSAEALVVTSPSVGLFGGFGEAGIWRSTDVGITWQPVFNDVCFGGGNAVAQLWFVNALNGWAVSGTSVDASCPSLLRTVNAGITWAAIPSPFGGAHN